MIKRVFISQPMRGLTADYIMRQRKRILEYVRNKFHDDDIEEIHSFIPTNDECSTPLECLAESLWLMADADIVVFAPGWEKSRGCEIEHECAKRYLGGVSETRQAVAIMEVHSEELEESCSENKGIETTRSRFLDTKRYKRIQKATCKDFLTVAEE